ncbi:MAG: class I SAM-dependent methyltransferase [Planctomycetes bacterium]|nr:class I SAM-dependent methyltransferase [Planctomycetota bacterium]
MTPADVAKATDGVRWMSLEHGTFFYDLIVKNGFRSILELGTLHGVGTCYLAAAAEQTGGHVVTVDLPWSATLKPEAAELLKKCGLRERVSIVRRKDGAEGFLVSRLDAAFAPFNFIYVDADHTYRPTVLFATLALASLVPGGYVCFDDINNSGYPDVRRAWQVVKQLPGVEITEHGNLGVCRRGSV